MAQRKDFYPISVRASQVSTHCRESHLRYLREMVVQRVLIHQVEYCPYNYSPIGQTLSSTWPKICLAFTDIQLFVEAPEFLRGFSVN